MKPIEALASRIGRPERSLSALASLSDEDLARLESAIAEARARQHETVIKTLSGKIPRPFRRIVLSWLGV